MEKTEVPGIYKVKKGVLINKDQESLAAYKKNKMRNRKLEQLEEDVQSMKNDLTEIKELLRGLAK